MKTLAEVIENAAKSKIAVGHFNVSDLTALKAIFNAARRVAVPVIIGVSEGEREFIGVKEIALLVRYLRDSYQYPIFLNADHTYSLEKIKEAVEAGFDSVIFDGAKLPLEENIKKTAEVVRYVKSVAPHVLVEGEVGYIGTSSKLLEAVPEGAAVTSELMTSPEEAERFVKETGVDLFAPAVGNIHGMFVGGRDLSLDVARIGAIKKAVGIPLVLHGGSGSADKEFTEAAGAGMAVIHINTEIRVAWRQGVEEALSADTKEVAPYKILKKAEERVSAAVEARLKLFSGL